MNKIQKQDISDFIELFPDDLKNELVESSFLITGATGLIGSVLVKCLLALNGNIDITCVVRNRDKVLSIYEKETEHLHFIENDINDYIRHTDRDFQYIIHCASPTNGKFMTENPVETYNFIYSTTNALLEYAKEHKTCSMVYISSLEYYGQILKDDVVTEDKQGYIDMTSLRSCYPLGKRTAEYLCTAYALEYGIDVKIARLTQTFGAGVSPDDKRVFAQFARSVISGNDIILHTTGESAKPYIYTIDCILAIFYILLKGNAGEAYNVANEKTYISIRMLAEFLCTSFNPSISIKIKEEEETGYAPITKLNLSTEKLRDLGWQPHYDLYKMFDNLINSMKE